MTSTARRLLLVVPSGTSFLTFFRGIADEWRRSGGTVAVATGPDLPGHSAAWPDGIERFPLSAFRAGSSWSVLSASRELAAVVSRWNPSLVHAHFAAAVLAAALARTIGGAGERRWIGTFHGMHLSSAGPKSISSRLAAAAEKWSARRMDTVCVLNREDAAAVRDFLPKGHIRVVSSCGVGCDLDAFDPTKFPRSSRDATRSCLGIAAEALVVAYVGRRTAFKGYDVAVRGFVQAGIEDAVLLLVGSPDDTHASGLTPQERAEVAADSRVVDAGWQWDVAPFLAAADICLLPSVREGMPVTAMEALALGVPVVTVDARGCRDVVRGGIDGIVLPVADPSLVAETLVALAADRSWLANLAKAAVAGRSRFDRRRYVLAENELYSQELAALEPNGSGNARRARGVGR